MPLILILSLLVSFAFADLSKLTIKNLDLDYQMPSGSGTIEKLQIGLSTKTEIPYAIHVERTENAFHITSSVLDFTWENPVKFIHDLQILSVKALSLEIDKKNHFLTADEIVSDLGSGSIVFKKSHLTCNGESIQATIVNRLMEDCHQKLRVKVKSLDLPFGLTFLEDTFGGLDPMIEEDMPANDLIFNVDQGRYYFSTRIKYYIKAGLYSWGDIKYEDDMKTIVIRVDKIKYGYLPVTNIVMRQLQERVRHPKININPPYIRIEMK
jgi:hypothetical protein